MAFWHLHLMSLCIPQCMLHIFTGFTFPRDSHFSWVHISPGYTFLPGSYFFRIHISTSFTFPPVSHFSLIHISPGFTFPPDSHFLWIHILPEFTFPLCVSYLCDWSTISSATSTRISPLEGANRGRWFFFFSFFLLDMSGLSYLY